MRDVIRNLCFEGAGPAGLGYAGALKALEELSKEGDFSFDEIERAVGTSSGSLAALLVCLNYSSKEIIKILKATDLSKLIKPMKVISNTNRVFVEYGYYDTDQMLNIVRDLIKAKTGSEYTTFGELNKLKEEDKGFKDLYVMTTKMYELNGSGRCDPFVFSYENASDTSIAEVIVASCAIQFFFTPVRFYQEDSQKYVIDKHGEKGDLFGDGGYVCNFPIRRLDHTNYYDPENTFLPGEIFNKETLGFRMDTKREIDAQDRNNPISKGSPIPNGDLLRYATVLITGSIFGQQEYQFQEEEKNKSRTVFIERLESNLINLNLTDKEKDKLIESGYHATLNFFKQRNEAVKEQKVHLARVSKHEKEEKSALLSSSSSGEFETVDFKEPPPSPRKSVSLTRLFSNSDSPKAPPKKDSRPKIFGKSCVVM